MHHLYLVNKKLSISKKKRSICLVIEREREIAAFLCFDFLGSSIHLLKKSNEMSEHIPKTPLFGQKPQKSSWWLRLWTMIMQVGPGPEYVLTVKGFQKNWSSLGDSMRTHDGMKFSAKFVHIWYFFVLPENSQLMTMLFLNQCMGMLSNAF